MPGQHTPPGKNLYMHTQTNSYTYNLGIPEARRVGVTFSNMQEVVTRTVDVSSKVAACWREQPPQTIYRSDAQCLYSQLVLVGKSSGKVSFSRRVFHVLNERKQKKK